MGIGEQAQQKGRSQGSLDIANAGVGPSHQGHKAAACMTVAAAVLVAHLHSSTAHPWCHFSQPQAF